MSDAIEARIATIWCSTLSTGQAHVADDFHAAGGDSMAVVTLIARVCEELDLEFDYREFLAHPTFGTLCSAVRAALATQSTGLVGEPGGSAHQQAVVQAERATRDLLVLRPFRDMPAKPTLSLAIAMSDEVDNVPPELRGPLALLRFLKAISS